jgi:glycosyltransferase involved in cell wall biosynthesis
MACGCFPVAGDIESLREWITPGVNGWLVDPEDPEALAVAIIASLENRVLREGAAKWNARLISERAEYQTCMAQAGEFYAEVLARSKPPKNP